MRRPMRATRPASKKPSLAVKTAPRRVAVARKSRVDSIARQVRSLQIAKYGAPQVQRQSFRSAQGLGSVFRLSNTQPVLWCHEAICVGNQLSTPDQDNITGEYVNSNAGQWVQQVFPGTADNAANARYDLQLWRNNKSLGVQPSYLVRGCKYDIQLFATNFNGYVEAYEITCNSVITRTTDNDRKLPQNSPSFIHMAKGGDSMYSHASQFYNIKRLWRTYFNTIGPAAGQGFLQTNNLKYKSMYKSFGRGKLITGTSSDINSTFTQDIPTTKQTWVLLTASNNTSDNLSNIRVQMQRNVYWRDSVGEK